MGFSCRGIHPFKRKNPLNNFTVNARTTTRALIGIDPHPYAARIGRGTQFKCSRADPVSIMAGQTHSRTVQFYLAGRPGQWRVHPSISLYLRHVLILCRLALCPGEGGGGVM